MYPHQLTEHNMNFGKEGNPTPVRLNINQGTLAE
jgi:hypothetical protein